MTAGTGVIHFEMPDKERIHSYECDYYIHAFQLWINLPRRDEMIKPRYQDISSSNIPLALTGDDAVEVEVIGDEALDDRATIHTRTPIFYPHFTLTSSKIV